MTDQRPAGTAILSERPSFEGGGQGAITAWAIFALGFFVAVAASSAWPAVAAIAGALAVYGFVAQPQRIEKQTEKFKALCQDHGTLFRKDISDPASGLFVGFSEETATVLMSHPISKHKVRDVRVNLNEVLNVELSVDQSAVYQAGPIAALSGAAVGGAVFGGAGAIVGSLAASQAGKGKIGSIALKLRVDDLKAPLVQIDFIAEPIKSSSASKVLTLAEQWTNLIEVIRYRMPSPASH